MLVLTRRQGQTIVIGGGIRITVVKIKENGHVILGIDAPVETTVHREEVQRLIDAGLGKKKTKPEKK